MGSSRWDWGGCARLNFAVRRYRSFVGLSFTSANSSHRSDVKDNVSYLEGKDMIGRSLNDANASNVFRIARLHIGHGVLRCDVNGSSSRSANLLHTARGKTLVEHLSDGGSSDKGVGEGDKVQYWE